MGTEQLAGPENQNGTWQYRHFHAGFRITARTLSLLPDGERAESTDFQGIASLKGPCHPLKDILQDIGGFMAGQADLIIYLFCQSGARHGAHAQTLCMRAAIVN